VLDDLLLLTAEGVETVHAPQLLGRRVAQGHIHAAILRSATVTPARLDVILL
jgi:hypothetical protein